MFSLLLVPGPPMSLELDSPSETEITLQWTPPDQPNGILIGYVLQYQRSENDPTVFLSNIQHEVYHFVFHESCICGVNDTTQSIDVD